MTYNVPVYVTAIVPTWVTIEADNQADAEDLALSADFADGDLADILVCSDFEFTVEINEDCETVLVDDED
jgi:hypothetical protein